MTQPVSPWVFDQTAAVALFAAHDPAIRLYRDVDAGNGRLAFPACAVAEASYQVGITFNQWASLLWPANVDLVPLDGSDVFATVEIPGCLAVRHTCAVARDVQGVIVTRAPWQYPPDAAPLRVI